MCTVFTPGGKDALAIERESQILAIFDTMGYGVVFDIDGVARFVRKKNLQRMFNYCRNSFSLANSGLQLLLQAVLQPDRRNFYGQSRRFALRLGLERESKGVDIRNCVHGVCANDIYRNFSHFLQYRFSINHE